MIPTLKRLLLLILLSIISQNETKAQSSTTQYSLDDFPYKIVYPEIDGPIMDSTHFIAANVPFDGKHFSFPSLLRIPDWIPLCNRPDPSAKYYLYFAHHYGSRYIRMAWSAAIEGPYHLYQVSPVQVPGTRGVLDIGYSPFVGIGNNLSLSHHINAPDVQVDHERQLILLYFTSGPQVPTANRDRYLNYRSYVATSSDGLCFKDVSVNDPICGIVPARIANHYNRVFQFKGRSFGMVNLGQIWGANSDFNPHTHDYEFEVWEMHNNPLQDYYGWTQTPSLVQEPYFSIGCSDIGIRHPMVNVVDDRHAQIFYSKYNDEKGEHICRALMYMPSEDPITWEIIDVEEDFMYPARPWEGSTHPLVVTTYGGGITDRELRDPYFFKDLDGKNYLIYVGGGEVGIGIVKLVPYSN